MPKAKQSLNEMLYEIRRTAQSREVLSEKRIKAMYESLDKDLNNFLAEQYRKYADTDGRFYVSALDKANKKAWFMNEIVKNIDTMTPELKKEAFALVDEVYERSYKGIAEAIKKADTSEKVAEVTKDITVRPETLKKAVNNNISRLTLPAVMEKHRNEIVYQIQQTLNIGLMRGERYETMAKRISERIGVSESKARNITRTETHRNIEGGYMDSAEAMNEKLEGSNLIYAVTWCTMQDERVRPQQRRHTKKGWKTVMRGKANHMEMDGKTVKVGDMFRFSDGTKTKCPGESGVAAHDCNCRCYLEYNLMTAEEFAKATGQSIAKVQEKHNIKPEQVEEKPQTTFEKMRLTGIDKDYVPDVEDTFNGLMRDYPVEGLTVKTNTAMDEFGHYLGGVKGSKRQDGYYGYWCNEVCVNKNYHKNKATSTQHHKDTYASRKSKLEKAARPDLATLPHEYGHAIDKAYVLAKEPQLKAFADKYKVPQKLTTNAQVNEINKFNRALISSKHTLSGEIFDELKKEYSFTDEDMFDTIKAAYGSYAASSKAEFLAEGVANMRLVDAKDKTEFMKSFEKIFDRKFKEAFGG